VISLDVRDPVDPRAVDDVFEWFGRVDDLLSTWRDDTEISRIGRGELDAGDASAEVREVLESCERLRRETGGAFDITVGASAAVAPRPGLAPVDPSGFVKGWAVERAAGILEAAGSTRFIINAGGDVVVRGHAADQRRWRLGIPHPWQRHKIALVVGVTDCAVATSGRAERGDHVIDPRTGLPARGLVSATIIGADLGHADALATAAVAYGSIDAGWLVGVAAMGITDERTVVSTPEFDAFRLD
jgi:thiamine biosynthesis lipoprotein